MCQHVGSRVYLWKPGLLWENEGLASSQWNGVGWPAMEEEEPFPFTRVNKQAAKVLEAKSNVPPETTSTEHTDPGWSLGVQEANLSV